MLVQPRSWMSSDRTRGGPRLRLSAAHDEWNHVGIALAAMEEGFFAQEGLTDVELISFAGEAVLLDREAAQVDLLAKGIVDIGIDPRTTFVVEGKNAAEPVCIIAARRKNHAFVVIGQKGLLSIDDLRGRSMCMSVPGGATDVMLKQVLADRGYQIGEDFEIQYVGGNMHDSANVTVAFRAGKYGPAILASTTNAPKLIEDGYPVLADLRKLYPSRHDRVTGANEDFVAKHPELVKGFLKGMMRACQFVLDLNNAARFKQIMIDAGFLTTQREQDNFDGLFMGWQERVSTDLVLPMDGIELIVDEERRAGKVADSFRAQDVLRLESHGQAVAELARS